MKILATLLSILLSTPAIAIDLTTPLLGNDNKPILECIRLSPDKSKCDEEVTLTLGWLSRFALDRPEPNLQLSDIIKRGTLAEKIKANTNLDLSVDEAKLIKDQIIKIDYRINVKYQAIKLIDPKGTEDAK